MLGMMFSRPRDRGSVAVAIALKAAPWLRTGGSATRLGKAFCERFDGVNAGGIDGGHIAQADDNYRLEGFDVGCGFDQFFCCAEEERAMDAQDGDVRRNDAALRRVGQAVTDVIVGDGVTVVVSAMR